MEGRGVVDQSVEAAETADRSRDELGQAIEFREVGLQQQHRAGAFAFERVDEGVGLGL